MYERSGPSGSLLVYVAFRVGAIVLKVVLGLLAIGLVWWLIQGLLAGTGTTGSSVRSWPDAVCDVGFPFTS